MDCQWKQWTDRFIPARINAEVANFNLSHSNVMSLSDCQLKDEENCCMEPIFANTAKIAQSILKHEQKLLHTIGINHPYVLKTESKKRKKILVKNCSLYWPVVARKRPLICKPEIVLDMPHGDRLTTFQYRYLTDWSKLGLLASVAQGEVYFLNPDKSLLYNTYTQKTVSGCVKFNKSGTHFAVCTEYNTLTLMNVKTLMVVDSLPCMCPIVPEATHCHISAVEWSTTNLVIKGCCNGTIEIINCIPWGKSKTLGIYRQIQLKRSDYVTDLKLSCYESYLLITTAKGKIYIGHFDNKSPSIRSLNRFQLLFKSSLRNLLSVSWHPWSEGLLAIGETNNRISIWNVKSSRMVTSNIVGPYFKKSEHCILNCILFSPLSGELVVSFYYEKPENQGGINFITVLKTLDTKVDEVRYHIGQVPHMLWNATGLQLATFGADENFVIWDFFGENAERVCKSLKIKQNVKPDPPMFGQCIR